MKNVLHMQGFVFPIKVIRDFKIQRRDGDKNVA